VTEFRVSSAGGHVMSDKVNWWIGLSPYFVPIYALVWMALWLTVDFYHPLKAWQPVLYFGIGFFWAFHVTFTWSMLHKDQTDLSREGYVFSGVIIALFNLLAVLVLLSLLARDVARAGGMVWQGVERSYVVTGQEAARAFGWVRGEWGRR
jgi:hypothetical protein